MTATFSKLGNYGRLGNALFQMAAVIGYAEKHNMDFVFPTYANSKLLKLSDEYFVPPGKININRVHKEPKFSYDEIPAFPNIDIEGYFQSPKYFDHCRDFIRESFIPANDYHNTIGTCSVHVRRGDYVNIQDFHTLLDLDYYRKAAEKISCNKFFIFSDDTEWCQGNFKRSDFGGREFSVIQGGDVISDFGMQIACENHIIANSSFSWWAAWLGERESSVTVAPNNWFGPKLRDTHSLEDLIPQNWIRG